MGDFAASVRTNWITVCGLACLFLTIWLHYAGGCYSLRGYTMEVANLRWSLNVFSCTAAVAIIACASRYGRREPMGITPLHSLPLIGAAACFLGTASALYLVADKAVAEPLLTMLAVTSGVLTGAGEGCLLFIWCTMTSCLGIRASLACIAAAMGVGGFAMAVLWALPEWFARSTGLVCPAVGFVCALYLSKSVLAESHGKEDAASDAPANLGRGAVATADTTPVPPILKDQPFLQLLAVSFFFGISYGLIETSYGLLPVDMYVVACSLVVAGTVLASILAFVGAFAFKLSAWDLIFRLSLPTVAVSYLMLSHEIYGIAGPAVHALGYQYFFVSLWPMLGSPRLRCGRPVANTVCAGLLAVQLGQSLGVILWLLLCADVAQNPQTLVTVSGAALFAALIVAVAFERPTVGWADVRPGRKVVIDARPDYERAIVRAQQDFGLSIREAEVCALLGRGRNRQYVADKLVISLETAKSHTANVYRKMGVHSQQELLDVLEMLQETIDRKDD